MSPVTFGAPSFHASQIYLVAVPLHAAYGLVGQGHVHHADNGERGRERDVGTQLQTCGWLVGDDVFAVASFLSLVFPELSHIEWSPPGSRAWQRFEVTYRRLVVVRTQERKRALRNGKDHKQPVSL